MMDVPNDDRVKVMDARRANRMHEEEEEARPSNARFANCELRRYRLEWDKGTARENESAIAGATTADGARTAWQRRIRLTELDLEDDNAKHKGS